MMKQIKKYKKKLHEKKKILTKTEEKFDSKSEKKDVSLMNLLDKMFFDSKSEYKNVFLKDYEDES